MILQRIARNMTDIHHHIFDGREFMRGLTAPPYSPSTYNEKASNFAKRTFATMRCKINRAEFIDAFVEDARRMLHGVRRDANFAGTAWLVARTPKIFIEFMLNHQYSLVNQINVGAFSDRIMELDSIESLRDFLNTFAAVECQYKNEFVVFDQSAYLTRCSVSISGVDESQRPVIEPTKSISISPESKQMELKLINLFQNEFNLGTTVVSNNMNVIEFKDTKYNFAIAHKI